jgi:hypothetical protein
VYWSDPDDGAGATFADNMGELGDKIVVAQLTIETGMAFSATMNAQGQKTTDDRFVDWRQYGLSWSREGVIAPDEYISGTDVIQYSTTDTVVPGTSFTSYRLTATLKVAATNIHTIFGTDAHPIILPAAYNTPISLGGQHFGGAHSSLAAHGDADYDSYLTIGETSKGAEMDGVSLAPMGAWNWNTGGVSLPDASIYWRVPANGPTTNYEDNMGGDGDKIVLAQLTVQSGFGFAASMNVQGRAADGGNLEGLDGQNDWRANAIRWILGGPELPAVPAPAPEPVPAPSPAPAPEPVPTVPEGYVIDTVVIPVVMDGIAGYTTYRLAVSLGSDAYNIYGIFGSADAGILMPAAYNFVGDSLSNGDLAGNFAVELELFPDIQYDSFLTVGATRGNFYVDESEPATYQTEILSGVGLESMQNWATQGLNISDGLLYVKEPLLGPTSTYVDNCCGNSCAVNCGVRDRIVLAQITVPNDSTFTATVNAQGCTGADYQGCTGEDWKQNGITFTNVVGGR